MRLLVVFVGCPPSSHDGLITRLDIILLVFQMSLVSGKNTGWKREDMVAIQDKKDKRACGFRTTDELYTNDQLWTLLKKYDYQQALMSASIGKSDTRKSDGPAGEQMLEKEGLVAGHAYSLIQAREVQGFKLVQLRM